MKIFTKTYDNGLRLVLEQNEKNVVAANILFFVGSNNENQDEEGLSHFIEHLVFKSSNKFTTEQIMENLTALGADFNAYTSKNLTRFIFKCLKENFEKCFEIYSDMLISPKMLDAEIDRERNVVIEEMKKYEDDPTEVMFQNVVRNYFEGTTYAHDVLGSEETISSVSRDKILEYKSRFYTANNAVISVAGNIEFDELDRIVTKYFASCFNKKAKPTKTEFGEIKTNCKKKYAVVERNDSQANVCVHIKAVPYDSKLKYVADLYTVALGNSSTSRLYKKVREELGLVYTIYSYFECEAKNGEIYIVFGTRPKNLKKALAEVRKIVDELGENGVTEEELSCIKNFKKSLIEYAAETNSETAEANGSFVHFLNKTVTLEERKANYDKVSAKDIKLFSEKIAKESNFNVVAVGKNLNEKDLKEF